MALTIKDGNDNARPIARWAGETTAGSASIEAYQPEVSMVCASVQASGTFGGATVVLQGSNDGVTYATLKDTAGDDLSFTAAGYVEFTSAAVFVKPSISGGTGDSLNITLAHWSA